MNREVCHFIFWLLFIALNLLIIRPTDSIELVNRAIRYLVFVEPEMPSASSAIDALRDLADLMETAQGENEQLQSVSQVIPVLRSVKISFTFLLKTIFV